MIPRAAADIGNKMGRCGEAESNKTLNKQQVKQKKDHWGQAASRTSNKQPKTARWSKQELSRRLSEQQTNKQQLKTETRDHSNQLHKTISGQQVHPRAAAAARLAEVARRSLLEYKRHTSKAVMGTTRKHQHHWTQFPKTTSGQLMIPRAAVAMGNNMRNQGKAWSIRGSAEPNQLELILDDLGPARFVLASVASITSNRQRIKNMRRKAKKRTTNETGQWNNKK